MGTRRVCGGLWACVLGLGFALSIAGPVHAQVTLTGDSAAVTLWAEHNDTAAALQGGISILEAALREAGLEPGALRVLLGAPRAVSVGPGKFLDQAT